MNQNSPTRGSLEEKTGWISTLLYSVEARLNLLNGGHILVKLSGGLNHVPSSAELFLHCPLGLVFGLRSASFHFRCAPETGLKCDASRGDRG